MIFRLTNESELLDFLAKKVNYSSVLLLGVDESFKKISNTIAIQDKFPWIKFTISIKYDFKSSQIWDAIIIFNKYLFFRIKRLDVKQLDIIYFKSIENTENPFIVSIPKSGTNLIHTLIGLLGYRVIGDGAKSSYAFLEETNLNQSRVNSYIPYNTFVSKLVSESNIAMSSHYLPLKFNTTRQDYGISNIDYFKNWLYTGSPPMVFNYRDPRDAIISLIFYIEKTPSFTYWAKVTSNIMKHMKSLDEKINYIVNFDSSFLDIYYRSHIWLYLHPMVCNVSYENLVGPQGNSSALEQYLSISRMIIHLGSEADPVKIANEIYSKKSRTYRKGVIREWHSCFSKKNQVDFREKHGDILEMYGYSEY